MSNTDDQIATKPVTPGAGVNPNKRIVPSKRVKALHRAFAPRMPLKAFARQTAAHSGRQDALIAKTWLASKGCQP